MSLPTEVATLAGGCFWCLEAVFVELRGVLSVESGYAGGTTPNPTYHDVCAGTTGHAEVAQVTFDPAVLTYDDVLRVLFSIHDPTTLNCQGGDIGTQYRSAIYTHSPAQAAAARAVIAEVAGAGLFDDPIVTEVAPLGRFWKAEAYHQGYYGRNQAQPYCSAVIAPKVAKFRKQYLAQLAR